MFTNIKHSIFTAGTVSLLSFGSLAVASPSYAINLDFSNWNSIGDVSTTSSPRILKTGDGTSDLPQTDGGSGSLEDFLTLSPAYLYTNYNAYQGSAIQKTLSVNSGDVFRFNFNFSPDPNNSDPNYTDIAFVTINNQVSFLGAGTSTFSKSFNAGGSYNIGIGVADVGDATGQSTLKVSNASVQPVPEPGTILGTLAALGFGARMVKRFGKQERV